MRTQDPPIELGAELDFLRELWALDHALQRRSKRMARDLGITGPQRLALRLVSRFPGLPAGRLARLLHLHPSTVSGVVKRLSSRGLIVRGSDGPDRRRSLLRVTPKGLELLARPEPTLESAVSSALESVNEKQIEAALRVLGAVAVHLSISPSKVRRTAGPLQSSLGS